MCDGRRRKARARAPHPPLGVLDLAAAGSEDLQCGGGGHRVLDDEALDELGHRDLRRAARAACMWACGHVGMWHVH
eukprot:80495-Prymnesium_polylepis.2